MIKLMQNYIHLQNWLFKKEPFAFLFDLHHHKVQNFYSPHSFLVTYSVGVRPKCFLNTVEK